MSYAWGQLRGAMSALSGDKSQRERLIGAYTCLMCLKQKDLPAEIHLTFDVLMKGMAPYSVRRVQREAHDKVNSLDDAEVITMISSIIDMYDLTTRYQPRIPLASTKGLQGMPPH